MLEIQDSIVCSIRIPDIEPRSHPCAVRDCHPQQPDGAVSLLCSIHGQKGPKLPNATYTNANHATSAEIAFVGATPMALMSGRMPDVTNATMRFRVLLHRNNIDEHRRGPRRERPGLLVSSHKLRTFGMHDVHQVRRNRSEH